MKIPYFPGCTLKTTAKNFEDSAVASARVLGIEMVELPRWNCCGTVYSLTSDDLMHQLGPIRNLIRVEEQKADAVVTLCSMCYNTLYRANLRVREKGDDLEKMNLFMDRENVKYDGTVRVYHLLTLLRDEVGFSKIRESVKRPLTGLKLAPYYGCTLLRPREIGIDDPENPTIMSELIEALGAEPVDFPYATECCASYQVVGQPELVIDRTVEIVRSAKMCGADLILTSCPLCDYNIGRYQVKAKEKHPELQLLPTVYFTQPLAFALCLDPSVYRFSENYIDPTPLLERLGKRALSCHGA